MGDTIKAILKFLLPIVAVVALYNLGYFLRASDDVRRAPGGAWGGGSLIGRPSRASRKGLFVSTMELQVNHGGLANSTRYLGSSFNLSTQSEEVFRQFNALDPNKDYVFEYVRPSKWRPLWQDTHYLVTRITEMRNDFERSGLPREIDSHKVREGTVAHGERAGVIVEVLRWGYVTTTCTVTVNLGGHSATGGEEAQNFVLYGESGCHFAEQLLPYGREVRVNYSEALWPNGDDEQHTVHHLRVLDAPAAAAAVAPTAPTAPTEGYEALRERLMHDPVFLDGVRRALADRDGGVSP